MGLPITSLLQLPARELDYWIEIYRYESNSSTDTDTHNAESIKALFKSKVKKDG